MTSRSKQVPEEQTPPNQPALGPQRLFNTRQAADYLGSSERFLEIGRMKGYGPKFIRCAPKMVRYRLQDLDAWVEERVRRSTSDQGA